MQNLDRASVALLLAATTFSAQANQIVNGSFELPAISAASFQLVVPGSEPAGFAWTVSFNSVDIISNGVVGISGPMFAGQQALDLVGSGTGGAVSQTFATVAGTTYQLRLAYANNPQATTTASAAITVTSGAATLLSDSVTHSTSSFSNLDWRIFQSTFTAIGSTATLRFDNTAGALNGGVFLDAIDVSPVPEPATTGMWLVGLGGLAGAAAVRRRGPAGA